MVGQEVSVHHSDIVPYIKLILLKKSTTEMVQNSNVFFSVSVN